MFRQFIHQYLKLTSVIHYNCNMFYMVVIPAAELKNVRSHKMLLKILYTGILL